MTSDTITSPPTVAWLVEVNGWVFVTFATTSKKAVWNGVSAYWDAFDSRRGGWPSGVSATRAIQYDDSWAKKDCGRRCFQRDQV